MDENKNKFLRIGVLAIIGSFNEHINVTRCTVKLLKQARESCMKNVEVEITAIRSPDKVNEGLDGLIIPGGETTVLSSFLKMNDFAETLQTWTNKPQKFTWGTCAGLIVMSNEIDDGGGRPSVKIGGIDITCVRNGYGRQNESHVVELQITNHELQNSLKDSDRSSKTYSGVFIRAPMIKSINSDKVKLLCTRSNIGMEKKITESPDECQPVGVMQDNKMATTFHPELTDDPRWHAYFLLQVLKRKYPVDI